MDLQDRVVVVTGASSGIGAATAVACAERGAAVALLARSRDTLQRNVAQIEATGGRARAFPVDLGDLDAVEMVCSQLVDTYGTIDVLVNNAGAGCWVEIDRTDPRDALQMTMVPYVAAFAMTHHLVKPMIRRGDGLVVNVTSPAAFIPMPGSAAYSVARGAMRLLTEATRADLHGTGVRCGLVTAGEVESGYWEANPGSRDRVPDISRVFGTLTNEDVAGAIVTSIERNADDVTVPRRLAALLRIYRAVPGPFRALVRATGWQRQTLTSVP